MVGKMVSTHATASSRHRFLLVVDSNAKSLFYTTTLLQRLRYTVWTAQTAEEAIEMATTAVPALLITAQFLDDMPAHKLILQLKQADRTLDIPIIVLGQKTDPADERNCLAAGAITCLSTPVDAVNLYRVLQVAVEPFPRMNIRINTSLSVTINDRTVQCREGEVASVLSEHGIYICTTEPYPLATKLPVIIHLAGKAISVDTEVIYSDAAGEGKQKPGMGLQFTRIDPLDEERIRKYIREEITRDID